MSFESIAQAWDTAGRDPNRRGAIHPLGRESDDAYEASGKEWADRLDFDLAGLGIGDDDLIVDFACGDGRVLGPMAALGWNVVGADASPAMLEACPAGIPTVCSNGPNLADDLEGLGLGTPAAVYALAVFIHYPAPLGASILAGLARSLRPEGFLLLDLPLYDVGRDPANWTDVGTWTLRELELVANAVDLSIVEAKVSPGAFVHGKPGVHHGALVILAR